MVQRKVANNKLGIQTYNTLKTEKRQANTKPSHQNHDGKSQGADFKAIKMKKSRLIRRSDVNIRLRSSPEGHQASRQPGKPPTLATPSTKKPSPCKSNYSSPNYMRSTSSSDARKERTADKESSISGSSKLQKVAKTLTKQSSFKKVRILTKAPSFKHTRTPTATCSSTLKDSKFPPYLKLKPGATEAAGKSVQRVCSYDHCSLNGDHHKSAPPLKRFLSSRRRLLKSQKISVPGVLSPRKAKPPEPKARNVGDESDDIFINISVAATQVSESLSDGPCSEIDYQEDTNLSGITFSPTNQDYTVQAPVKNEPSFECDVEVESSRPSVSLDEFFSENSDLEWEEGDIHTTNEDGEIYVQSDYSNNQSKPGCENGNSSGKYLEELYAYPPYFHDEIVEYLCFSDADSLPDTESSQIGDKDIEEPVVIEGKKEMNCGPNDEEAEKELILKDEATIQAAKQEDESINEEGGILSVLIKEVMEAQNESTDEPNRIFSDLLEEIIECQNEDIDSYQEPVQTAVEESNEDKYMIAEIREENAAKVVTEEREPSEATIKGTSPITENSKTSCAKEGNCMANDDDQDSNDQSDAGNETQNFLLDKDIAGQKENDTDNYVISRSANSEDGNDSSEANLHSNKSNFVEVKASEMGDMNSTEEEDASPTSNKMQETSKRIYNNGEIESNQELLHNCSIFKRGCRKVDENVEKEREFNPRGPNFLEIEPDPEAEKVDLRHQEMEERRNAEEWMLDYALQKTVNQLAPARKKKVALLVAAFEAVLPEPNHESDMRRNSSCFSHEKPIQSCS